MSADVKEKHILLYYSVKGPSKVKVENQPFQPVWGRKKAVNIPSIIWVGWEKKQPVGKKYGYRGKWGFFQNCQASEFK